MEEVRFLTDARGLLDALIGGWQVQGIYQYQSGRPLAWGTWPISAIPTRCGRTSRAARSSIVGNPTRVVFDTSQFFSPGVDIRLRNNIRTFPSTPGFRSQAINQLDLSVIKNRPGGRGAAAAARGVLERHEHAAVRRAELDPTSSSFGRVTSQVNLPRNIQVGLRCVLIGIALAACWCSDRGTLCSRSIRRCVSASTRTRRGRCATVTSRIPSARSRRRPTGICGSARSSVCFASTESDTCCGSRRQASTSPASTSSVFAASDGRLWIGTQLGWQAGRTGR